MMVKIVVYIVYFLISFSSVLTNQCGHKLFNSKLGRIVGGKPVGYYKYPWFAILESPGQTVESRQAMCAGTLITPKHVVTAAHCFEGYSDGLEDLYIVVLGVYDNCLNEDSRVAYDVQKALVHAGYIERNPWHDIALLTLKTTADNEVACLPTAPGLPETAVVTGFGVTKSGLMVEPCEQQEVEVNVYNNDTCVNMLKFQEKSDNAELTIPVKAFCAGYLEGGKDSCQGDSGGPLAGEVDGLIYLYGLVSFGYNCAMKNALGVYTKLYDYRQWLRIHTDGYLDGEEVVPTTKKPKPAHPGKPNHSKRPRPHRYSIWDKISFYENLKKISPAHKDYKNFRNGRRNQ